MKENRFQYGGFIRFHRSVVKFVFDKNKEKKNHRFEPSYMGQIGIYVAATLRIAFMRLKAWDIFDILKEKLK